MQPPKTLFIKFNAKLTALGPRRRLNLRIILFSLLALGVGFLTPHIFKNHVLILRQFGESLLFLLNFAFIILVFGFYYRDLKKLEAREQRSRDIMTDTFKHLGIANRKVEVLKSFMDAYKQSGTTGKREVIQELFNQIMVSLLHSPLGILRVIEKNSGRTLTEWRYRQPDIHRQLSFSNKNMLRGRDGRDQQLKYIPGTDIAEEVCVIGYLAGKEEETSQEFVTTLLNQVFLLIIAFGLIKRSRSRRIIVPARSSGSPGCMGEQ